MKKLTAIEEIIFNQGERLIPGVTHNLAELVRHKSSYQFFKTIIERDGKSLDRGGNLIRIADLGCGVGHGCETLAKPSNAEVWGMDCSGECMEYAQQHYSKGNIRYQQIDLEKFIPTMEEYHYVVSRGVFEHVSDGLNLALSSKFRFRLMFDVPYDEPDHSNPHHVLKRIREEHFSMVPQVELFYQDLEGIIYDSSEKPEKPNMIVCVRSHPDLPKISEMNISFPFAAWVPDEIANEYSPPKRRVNPPFPSLSPRNFWKGWVHAFRGIFR